MPLDATHSPAEKPGWPGHLALALLVGLVYRPVLGFDFVRWDDDINITQNPLLTAPWSGTLAAQFFGGDQALRFEPLHWLCFRVLHALCGFNPAGWHAFNLGLHLVAAGLFYGILRTVFRRMDAGRGKIPVAAGAWLGAALWALHPLRAEAVAWATASTYPLTTVGLLASFACYLRARTGPSRRWLVLAWIFAVAAYGSYPVGLTYGLWLMAVDRWLPPAVTPGDRPGKSGLNPAGWVRPAWFLAPAVLAVGVTLWSRFTAPGIFVAAPTLQSVGLPSRLVMALASLAYLVRCLFWPVGLTPNLPPLVVSGNILLLVMAALALVGLILAWRGRLCHPARALVALGFAGLALPCLGWTERPAWPPDRYSYLVHLVLVGGLAGALAGWAGDHRIRRLFLGACSAVLVLLSAWAVRGQIMVWRNSPAFFTYLEGQPHFADNPRQQGHVYVLWGRYEASAGHPAGAAERFNRAQEVYLAAIRAAVARLDYAEALSLSTHLGHYFTLTPVMHRERGAWLLRLNRRPEARGELLAAAASMPDDARVRQLLQEVQP